jgi:hypothetical protein
MIEKIVNFELLKYQIIEFEMISLMVLNMIKP